LNPAYKLGHGLYRPTYELLRRRRRRNSCCRSRRSCTMGDSDLFGYDLEKGIHELAAASK
jgi:hypothetical protein